MEIGRIYFWTATILNWKTLLMDNDYKEIIIESLSYLSKNELADIFAFVIMPNHIHLIWRLNKMNGKQGPHQSFLKYTAQEFMHKLKQQAPSTLNNYLRNARNKIYQFWRRDSLAIELYSRKVAYQKLDYVHNNPLNGRWQLASDPCRYAYSSASFYAQNDLRFSFLKDLRREL